MKRLTILVLMLLAVCVCASEVSAGELRIEYGYGGKTGVFGIASTARAYYAGVLIAEAKAERIIKRSSGPNQLEVKETHYSKSGSVIYMGTLIFQFSGIGAALVEEQADFGTKQFSVFVSWPDGGW